ncbi:hypothetical protein [Salinarchaeum laminariae]|uniref:hypothetical protein n=1 Tax=Salinarchaeum laminariae TaxID=869888 RepID=UPI0020C0C1A6|nr:hypothetical protein [Salinarchaeum laminariae]
MELPDIEIAHLWSAVFAAYSLVFVIAIIVLWAVITFFSVGLLFPNANTIEIGKVSASVLGIIVNLGLSGGLLYIYVRQTGVLRDQRDLSAEQTSIQDQQRKIMGAEYVPEVDVFVDGVEDDEVILQCSNEGTGLAKQFEVDVEFYVSEESMDDPPENGRGIELTPLWDNIFTSTSEVRNNGEVTQEAHYTGKASTPRRETSDDNLAQVRTPEILREEDDATLQFRIYFERFVEPGGDPGNPDHLSFSEGVDALQDEGIETLGFKMHVTYQDIFDEEAANELLTSGWVDIRDGTSVTEMLETAENRGVFHQDTHPLQDRGTTYHAHYYSYI